MCLGVGVQFEVLKRNISVVAQNTVKLREQQFNIVPINIEKQAKHATLAIREVIIPIRHSPNGPFCMA